MSPARADCGSQKRTGSEAIPKSHSPITSALRRIALCTLLLPLAASANEGPPPDPFGISLDGAVGIPQGYVQVRENNRKGTRLSLHGDLGIDTVETVALDAAYHFCANDAVGLDFDTIFLYGSKRLRGDVLFNGALLQGGTTAESRPDFFRLTGLWEHRLWEVPGGGRLLSDFGFTYVMLEYKLNATLSPRSAGSETKEDFLTQELPVPMIGLSLEQPISDHVSFVGSALGGYLPQVDSLRNEGGDVKLSQSHADAFAKLRYHVTPNFDVEAGYAFHYFNQREASREDGNYFKLWHNDLKIGLAYRF